MSSRGPNVVCQRPAKLGMSHSSLVGVGTAVDHPILPALATGISGAVWGRPECAAPGRRGNFSVALGGKKRRLALTRMEAFATSAALIFDTIRWRGLPGVLS